ncbi:hypothetical protein [Pseudochelatococcus sp. G4_1912]|uniref:hypothetical protein n=1 Tax=Pseudochelatococcus sp. G4_1912 TaxID=3114288 RepID=UPI0039C6EE3E
MQIPNVPFLPLLSGYLHLQRNDRDFYPFQLTFPAATNVIAGAIIAASTSAQLTATQLITNAASLAAASATVRAVSWIVGSGAIATGAGVVVGGALGVGSLFIDWGLYIALFRHHGEFADRAAIWLDGFITSLHWHSLLLNAKSCLGLVTAEMLNSIDEDKISHISLRILHRLPSEEIEKIEDRIINHLPYDETIHSIRNPLHYPFPGEYY